MTPGARVSAAITVLDQIISGAHPEKALSGWSRGARYAGSRDRAAVRDLVFDALRRRRSAVWASGASAESGRALAIGTLALTRPEALETFDGAGHAPQPLSAEEKASLRPDLAGAPAPVAGDHPDFLDAPLERALGARRAQVLALLKDRAPVDLRVNTLRTSVETARAELAVEGYEATTVPGVATALRLPANTRGVIASHTFRRGHIELQDAASQAAAAHAGAQPGMAILDLCAGGGGKTLALAAAMRGEGHLVAHDIDSRRMRDLPGRAARAGAQVIIASPRELSAPVFDLVFVDAPCSGSGAWRRDPAQKWRLTEADIPRLTKLQDLVLDTARGLLRPGGAIAYATCSLLVEENRDRIDAFLARTPGAAVLDDITMLPGDVGDGFYFAKVVLK